MLFEQKDIEVDDAFIKTYDMTVDMWMEAWELIQQAKEEGTLQENPKVI